MAKVDIEQLAFDYNNAIAKDKLTNVRCSVDELLVKYNYKNRAVVTVTLHNAGYRKRQGRFIKCTETINERRKKETAKVKSSKTIVCNFPGCNIEFTTPVDKLGVPYRKRCSKCSTRLKLSPVNDPIVNTGRKISGVGGDS